MAILNKAMLDELQNEILGQKVELVEVKPGLCVKVVQLSAEAGFGLVNMAEKEKTPERRNFMGTLRWIAASCVDDEGNEVFTLDYLKKMPFEFVQKLAQAVNKVNGIASSVAIEEAEKNSGKASS